MPDQNDSYASWSVLELMGHRRLGGFVQEQQIAGAGFFRIDIPGPDGQPSATQFYPPSALYCLTPVTEEMARAVAVANQIQPVTPFALKQLAAAAKPAVVNPENEPAGRGGVDDWAEDAYPEEYEDDEVHPDADDYDDLVDESES